MIDNEREVLIGTLLEAQKKKIVMISSDKPVTKAAKLMAESKVGSVVIKNDIIEGIITKGDIINRVLGKALDPGIILVADVMSKPIIYISSDETLENTMLQMAKENIERILVVEDNDLSKPLGIISTNDIIKFAPGLLRIRREKLLIGAELESDGRNLEFQGFCDDCGNFSLNLRTTNGYTLCPDCFGSQREEDIGSDDEIM
ncbi:MAG: CBS domain-containing protein [Candidatus Heimdallarchaeota archaeon]|nr:CBS domain-containing protein [Candidatus Heimdallarchaeota archaeon]